LTPWQYAKPGCSEHASQTALFVWCKMAERYGITVADDPRAYENKAYAEKLAKDPVVQLKWLFAIPNGGERSPSVAAAMAAEGAKKGVADVFLPVAVCGDNGFGLFIEMKKEIYRKHKDCGRSQQQLDFAADMLNAGYDYKLCFTWLEARDCLLNYLGLKGGWSFKVFVNADKSIYNLRFDTAINNHERHHLRDDKQNGNFKATS